MEIVQGEPSKSSAMKDRYGYRKPEVIYVGKAPGPEEVYRERPLIGSSGDLIRGLIGHYGGGRPYALTNLLKCQPTDEEPSAKSVELCGPRLLDELRMYPSARLVALGGPSLHFLTGQAHKITQAEGSWYTAAEGVPQEWVLGSYDPAAIFRARSVYPAFEFGMAKAWAAQPVYQRSIDEPFVIFDYGAKESFVPEYMSGPLAVDIETTGTDFTNGHITCVVLSGRDETLIIPNEHVYGEKFRRDIHHLWSNKNVQIGGHNFKFDLRWLMSHYALPYRMDWDTLLEHVSFNEGGLGGKVGEWRDDISIGHGLKLLARKFLDVPEYNAGVEWEPTTDEGWQRLYQYAAVDGRVTWLLHDLFQKEYMDERARRLAARLYRYNHEYTHAEVLGMRLDVPYAEGLQARLVESEGQFRDAMEALLGRPFNPNSTPQLQRALYGGEPYKLPVLNYTKTGKPSCDADTLKVLIETNPDNALLRLMLKQRRAAKFNGTYVKGWLEKADDNGFVHPNINIFGTVTGRPSASDPNILNIPTRGSAVDAELGVSAKSIKNMIVPRSDDHVILSCDYSQAELRWMAYFAGEEKIIQGYREDFDFHTATVNAIWPDAADPDEMRRYAKVANFLIIYMGSPATLAESVWNSFPEEERQRRIRAARGKERAYYEVLKAMTEFHRGWLHSFPAVPLWWNDTIEEAFTKGELVTPYGRRRKIGFVPDRHKFPQEYEELKRHIVNFPIQSASADMTQEAMCRVGALIRKEHMDAGLMAMVYDSLVYSVHKDCIDELAHAATEIMADVPKSIVGDVLPFKADKEVGNSWGELLAYDEWRVSQLVQV
jgi:DNA polymerase-1